MWSFRPQTVVKGASAFLLKVVYNDFEGVSLMKRMYSEETEKDLMNLRFRLKSIIDSKHLTTQDMAAILNIDDSHMYSLLSGRRVFTLPMLIAICRALDVTIDDLLFYDEADQMNGLKACRVDYTIGNILEEMECFSHNNRLDLYAYLLESLAKGLRKTGNEIS